MESLMGSWAWRLSRRDGMRRRKGTTPNAGRIGHYHAEGMFHWDTWYVPVGEEIHMFHLQVLRPGSDRSAEENKTVGHAVSKDLIRWKELPTALYSGPEGACDQGALFTGYAVYWEGMIYLFYCGNGPDDQSMCLATSTDGVNFTKHLDNPIIRPDGKTYVPRDGRDLVVVRDPGGDGWLGYVVMRLQGESGRESCCIVLCRSDDLLHWDVGEPVFRPHGLFQTFEVPEVFPLGGKWYMTNLTGTPYGQVPGAWSDPNMKLVTMVAESDSPYGPFERVPDNLLLGSTDTPWQGYSARSVEFRGERLLLFSRGEGVQGFLGRLSWPVKLVARKEGGLWPMYWHGVDKVFSGPEATAVPDVRDDGFVPISMPPNDEEVYMIGATVALGDGDAAGVAFGQARAGEGGYLALLDTHGGEEGRVCLVSALDMASRQDRWWPVRKGGTYRLRLLVVHGMVDIYVDDVLVINYYLKDLSPGGVSLFVRGDSVRFMDLEYRSAVVDSEAL